MGRVVESITEFTKTVLDCRDRGHAWFDSRSEPALKRSGSGLVVRVLVCTRCKTRREDWIVGTSGEIVMRRYSYPDGYRLKPGSGYAAKTQVRALAVRAAFSALRARRSA